MAKKIAEEFTNEIKNSALDEYVREITATAPGFVNFHLSKKFFVDSVGEILNKNLSYGRNTKLWNKKIIIEHTNLNPFKPFHIGHIVNNTFGESLSRILVAEDAKLTKASYGGDVGLHIAKAMWGIKKIINEKPADSADPKVKTDFLGKAYVLGNEAYDTNPESQKEIQELNKKIFDKSDPEIDAFYQWGRVASLRYFEELYKLFDSTFQYHFYESDVANKVFQ